VKILFHPFTQKLRTGMPSAKQYPADTWKRVVAMLPEHEIIQIGVHGEEKMCNDFRVGLPLREIEYLVRECDTWVCCDSFLQHMAVPIGKPGVVVWSVSDPLIFGYQWNRNVIKDRSFLRADQFGMWESETFNLDAFPSPRDVVHEIRNALCIPRLMQEASDV